MGRSLQVAPWWPKCVLQSLHAAYRKRRSCLVEKLLGVCSSVRSTQLRGLQRSNPAMWCSARWWYSRGKQRAGCVCVGKVRHKVLSGCRTNGRGHAGSQLYCTVPLVRLLRAARLSVGHQIVLAAAQVCYVCACTHCVGVLYVVSVL